MNTKTIFAVILALFLALIPGGVRAAGPTPISGGQSGTLYLTNSPYIVTGDIFMPPGGQTLTIEPGVVLQFTNDNIGVYIDGTLIARGTSASPILFTSDKTAKQPGQWKGIDLRSFGTSNTVLENCTIEYAGSTAGGFLGNVLFDSPPPVLITNCTIRYGSGNGMTIYNSDPRVLGCTFANNTNFALAMRADSLPTLRSNAASNNGKNAIGVFGGGANRSGTWTRDNIPYTVYEDLFVQSTLTLEPGTTIQFQDLGNGCYVDGTLIARGTAANPILFTSDKSVKAPGQWKGIDVRSFGTSNTVLENCTIEYAGSAAGGFLGNVVCEGGAPSILITNCTIRYGSGNGMTIYRSDPRVLGCTFANNTNFALAMRADSLPTLRSNTASANGKNAIGVFSGGANRSGTWTRDNIPYTVYEDLFVQSTLTLDPGTTIQFQDLGNGCYVDGTLIARGTAANPILFTSDKSVKAPGQWKGIDVRSFGTSNTVLENCTIEYAGSAAGGFLGNVVCEGGAPSILITNCTIRYGSGNGMTIYGSDPRVLGCTFANNTNFALAMRAESLPTLRNNTASANGKNAIGVFGSGANRSGTWTRDNIPYTVYEDLFVQNTLTLEPGLTIQFQDPGNGCFIDGTLIARGTAANPILFTSDESVKAPGQWKGVDVRSFGTANTILENCIIEYGASVAGGFNGNIILYSAPPILITNCTIRSSFNDGIYCNASSPRISTCRITNNGRDGVRTENASSPIVTNSAISGSTGFGINNLDTSRIINGQGNYWGHASGPFDNLNLDGLGLLNTSGLGDKVSEFVNWSPFLGSDPTSVSQVPAIALNTASLDFGSVTVGQISNLTVLVSNIGNSNLTVNSIISDNTRFSLVSPSTPFNVATGANQTVTIRFAPTVPGPQTGTLSVNNNDPAKPTVSVGLSGSGLGTNCLASPTGLVAWWRAEGDALDAQGANHAGLSNGVTFVSGEVGRAFSFDGVNQYVATPLDVQPSALPSTTWEAWVYPTRISGRQQILCNDDGGFDRGVMVEGDTFGIFTGSGVWTPVSVTTNQWQHIAVVFTPANIEFYKNGTRFSWGSAPTFGGSTLKLEIARNPGFGEYYQGRIDDVSIYNRALTSNEVAAIYASGAFGKCVTAPPNAPDIAVTPLALNFGNVTVGQTNNLSLTISNVGNTTLTINSITANNARFSLTAPATPFNIAAGALQLVTVSFAPNTAGGQTGQLSIVGNDPDEGTVNVALTGNGVAASTPDIDVSPPSLSFGSVSVGQTNSQTLTISNIGTATLTVNSITANNARFSITAPGTPFGIVAGTRQLITVSFLPNASGTQNGQLTIASTDPDEGIVNVALSGNGAANTVPDIAVSPHSLDFGTVVAGQTKTLVVGVANNGNATLTVNSITSNNSRFGVSGPTSFNIPPGSTPLLNVNFNPTTIGFQTGQLTFNSNDPDQPTVTVALAGTGVSATEPANLICNPGAELGAGSATGNDLVSIPGWVNESGFTVAQYGAAGFPTVGESQRIGGGGNFFYGGPTNSHSRAYQVIDVSARAADIDAGRLTAILRAQLGGFANERDAATLWAFYRDANNGEMGGLSVGPTQGTNNTFSLQVNTFPVPPGARFIRMEMIAARANGSDNNAYFDNLYLGLAGGTEPPGGGGRCSPDTSVTNCLPAFPGLIGWWPGDGNANDLVGGNHGTASGNANYAAGKVGQSFNFSATGSAVSIPDAPALRPAKVSIEAWVRFNSLDAPSTTTPGLQYLVCKPTQDSVGSFFSSYALGKWRSGGKDRFTLNLTSADSSVLLESTQGVVVGQFYHVVGTYDGSVAKLFVNGVLDDSVPISLSLDYDSHLLYFGSAGLTEGWFQGQLDEVSIYNRALSDSEITSLYVVGYVGKCKTGTYPTIDVSLLSLDFVNVIVGESKDRSLTVRNVGTGPLTVNSIGSDNPSFIVISPLGSFNVATGAQQVVTVRFTPTTTNSQTATLSIRSDASNAGIVNVLCSGNGTSTNCPVVPAGIVGWWPGQDNANDIIGGHNGAVSSGVTFAAGKVGQAFQFAGPPSSVSIPDAPELRPAQVTVEAWVRFDALNPADVGLSYLVSKYWNKGTGYFMSYALTKFSLGGTNHFRFHFSSTDAEYSVGNPEATLVAGQYYHVAGTYDGSVAKLYVNGALQHSGNVSVTLNYDANPLRFGHSGIASDRGLQGQLDEVSIYNRALTANEIASIYYAGAAGKCGGNASLIVPLAGSTPQPAPSGSQLVISWPDSPAALHLQSTTDFINWFNVTNSTVDASGANTVTELITGKLKFYRLVR